MSAMWTSETSPCEPVAQNLARLRQSYLASERVVRRWEQPVVDSSVYEWVETLKRSGALRAALDAVASEDPELADS